VLVMGADCGRIARSEVPFPFVLEVVVPFVDPETVLTVGVAVECEGVTLASVSFNSIYLVCLEIVVSADVGASEIPSVVFDIFVMWVNPEAVVPSWVSMEGGVRPISLSMALAFVVFVLLLVLAVRANEVEVVNELPLSVTIASIVRLHLSEFVLLGRVSVISLLMAETFVAVVIILMFEVDKVVTRDFAEVPSLIGELSTVLVNPESVVSGWISVKGGKQMATVFVTLANEFIVHIIYGIVVRADEVRVLFEVPDHIVGRAIVLLVMPESIFSGRVSVIGVLVLNVSTVVHLDRKT
jgi:hypothetical protein